MLFWFWSNLIDWLILTLSGNSRINIVLSEFTTFNPKTAIWPLKSPPSVVSDFQSLPLTVAEIKYLLFFELSGVALSFLQLCMINETNKKLIITENTLLKLFVFMFLIFIFYKVF